MGCDIHMHGEVKINGKWEHYGFLPGDRRYGLFAKMAGVRDYPDSKIVPIAKPRGIPKNATRLTKFDKKRWGEDGHSHSWLSAKEISDLVAWVESLPGYQRGDFMEHKFFGYLFGNDWSDFVKYPEDRQNGVEDARIVFWFDN